MNLRLTDPEWLLLFAAGLVWTIWWFLRSDVQVAPWRRWTGLGLRLVILACLGLAVAGLQWLRPIEGMNVYFVLDRSDSIPGPQQDWMKEFVNGAARKKEASDRAGVIVFGADAGIEFTPNPVVDLQKIQAVVDSGRSDIGGALRLATAAFPETGQKRVVLVTDGNANMGDAMSAVLAAESLGVTIDVVPVGVERGVDVTVERVGLPGYVKKGQTFDVRVYAEADEPQQGTIRLFRNDQYLGEQEVELAAGKNLFSFPQMLPEAGFYSYELSLEAEGDPMPQNNRARGFVTVRGDPRVLLASSDLEADQELLEALGSSNLEVAAIPVHRFPGTLEEIQSYDAIFLSNVAAGDLGNEVMRLVESAVKDFGVGLVVVGGDQAFAAGGYRNTPLERALPLDMELSSKKVLPNGALVLIMHGMEFNNGNETARRTALAALDALGPQDEMGVVLWDGTERWLFPLTKAQDKKALGRQIAGMNQGDLPHFEEVMTMAHEGLKESKAHLKHIVVFSDGDPGAPSDELMESIVADRITVSSVLIAGHAGPETMIGIADRGQGRFYDVRSPAMLPQIFVKEAAVVLKSAIFEEPFVPQLSVPSEITRGIAMEGMPALLGYVATTAKQRAEVALVSGNGDPVLGQWQYGLGRAVAFTSDARAKWAQNWLGWDQYRQFWSQAGQWSLRRVEISDLSSEVRIEGGEGLVTVEALDEEVNFRNFLNLQATVVGPDGDRQDTMLEQTGPGRYETAFPTREVGSYIVHLMEVEDGEIKGSQVLGATLNYSPEFTEKRPNLNLLHRIAQSGRGEVLPADPERTDIFQRGRERTFQPQDLWEWLMRLAIILFPLDVGVRRIQLDRAEWMKATASLRRWLLFWRGPEPKPEADEGMAALLARRDRVRETQEKGQGMKAAEPRADLFRPRQEPVEKGEEEREGRGRVGSGGKGGERAEEAGEREEEKEEESTTSRLLAAKRRAQRKR